MRKVAKILYLVGGIVSIVTAAGLFTCALVCIIFSTPILEEIAFDVYANMPGTATIPMDDAILALRIYFITIAVCLLIIMAFAIVIAVLSFKARKVENKGLFIKCIVFSILGSSTISLVASILSLIAHTREENKKAAIEESK
ncbi:MAG: hypothetical protein K6E11_02470 [Bacilli bacterium]|nr:hypothetical protein [Bacilli bacterium]